MYCVQTSSKPATASGTTVSTPPRPCSHAPPCAVLPVALVAQFTYLPAGAGRRAACGPPTPCSEPAQPALAPAASAEGLPWHRAAAAQILCIESMSPRGGTGGVTSCQQCAAAAPRCTCFLPPRQSCDASGSTYTASRIIQSMERASTASVLWRSAPSRLAGRSMRPEAHGRRVPPRNQVLVLPRVGAASGCVGVRKIMGRGSVPNSGLARYAWGLELGECGAVRKALELSGPLQSGTSCKASVCTGAGSRRAVERHMGELLDRAIVGPLGVRSSAQSPGRVSLCRVPFCKSARYDSKHDQCDNRPSPRSCCGCHAASAVAAPGRATCRTPIPRCKRGPHLSQKCRCRRPPGDVRSTPDTAASHISR